MNIQIPETCKSQNHYNKEVWQKKMDRPLICGGESVEKPFPKYLKGAVTKVLFLLFDRRATDVARKSLAFPRPICQKQ